MLKETRNGIYIVRNHKALSICGPCLVYNVMSEIQVSLLGSSCHYFCAVCIINWLPFTALVGPHHPISVPFAPLFNI